MIDCYGDDSVMQHVGIAISDGVRAAARGHFPQAWQHWTDSRIVVSAQAAIRTARPGPAAATNALSLSSRFRQNRSGRGRTRDPNDQLLRLDDDE
jgi:hypothetical protein